MKTETYTCQSCGANVERPVVRGQRPKWCPDCRARSVWNLHTFDCQGCGKHITGTGTRYCSIACANRSKPPRVKQPRKPRKPKPYTPRPQFREERKCDWCGVEFTAHWPTQTYCSSKHKARAKFVRRRGRAHGWATHYTWAEFMRIFLAFDRCCAYCEQPIKGQPDPDHVVPLSKGGSNSITNILPSCRRCNSDKRDLLLDEWARDREQRGKPPRVTTWAVNDPRVQHLTVDHMAAA